jgi:hypothetical protein
MPSSSGLVALSAAGTAIAQPGNYPNNRDNIASLQISGTFTSLGSTSSLQISKDPVSTAAASVQWQNVECIRADTLALESTLTLTNSTVRQWMAILPPGTQQVQFNLVSIGTGTVNVRVDTGVTGAGSFTTTVATNLSGNQNITGTMVITATNANAFSVGQAGSTNAAFNVNTNTGSSVTGISVVSNAAGSGVAVQVTSGGANEALTIDAKAAAVITIAGQAASATGVTIGSSTAAANCVVTIQSSNATALVVGRLGATTPAFQVNAATATQTTGVKVTGAANTGGVAVAAIGGNGNENMTVDAVGSGVILVAGASTGGCNVRVPVTTSAASGNTISNANASIKEGFNYVTAANNSLAVILPVGAVGMQVTIVNAVYTAGLIVFPQVNAAINNLTANTSYNMGNGAKRIFTYAVANQWYTDLVAID